MSLYLTYYSSFLKHNYFVTFANHYFVRDLTTDFISLLASNLNIIANHGKRSHDMSEDSITCTYNYKG